jgi:ATP-dependent Lhr-like helicase
VVVIAGEPILYLERGGRALQTLVPGADPRLEPALRALVDQVRAGRIKRLGLEKVDGETALTSSLASVLLALGFHEGPRRMTLGA